MDGFSGLGLSLRKDGGNGRLPSSGTVHVIVKAQASSQERAVAAGRWLWQQAHGVQAGPVEDAGMMQPVMRQSPSLPEPSFC
jgi:hypothetical protein